VSELREGDEVIELRPYTIAEANAVVRKWHSHHKPTRGHKFSVGAYVEGTLAGAVIVGRPVAPALQRDGLTWEVTRLCCEGTAGNVATRNVASRLLGAAWDASHAQGIRLLVSYTRTDEPGTCYRAAGWAPVAATEGKGWTSGNKSLRWLPGMYEPTTEIVDRVRWEKRPHQHVMAVLKMLAALGRFRVTRSVRRAA
jgi:hypothetical protein